MGVPQDGGEWDSVDSGTRGGSHPLPETQQGRLWSVAPGSKPAGNPFATREH